MNISITIGVTPQLEKALLGLSALVASATPNTNVQEVAPAQPTPVQLMQQAAPIQTAPVQQPAPIQQVPVQQEVIQQQPQSAPIQTAPVQSVPTAVPTYSMDQLAVAATQLVDAGHREQLLQLLASFGVQALTSLPTEQYGVFATKLRELGAKI